MAPRQLLLELEEVDMAAGKGPKRVRVDRADESSTQMVSSSFDPFLPTAAELAGDAPANSTSNVQPSERQARHLLAHRAQPTTKRTLASGLAPAWRLTVQ
eukprot:scaffold19777_cov169-Isochrysis_galbana.AAC.2